MYFHYIVYRKNFPSKCRRYPLFIDGAKMITFHSIKTSPDTGFHAYLMSEDIKHLLNALRIVIPFETPWPFSSPLPDTTVDKATDFIRNQLPRFSINTLRRFSLVQHGPYKLDAFGRVL